MPDLQEMLDGHGLPLVEPVLVHEHIASNRQLTPRLHLGELGRKAIDAELEPSGEIP